MRKIAAGFLAACLLSACGGNVGDTAQESSAATTLSLPTTAAATSTTPTGPVINERGNIVKQFGEMAGLVDANGNSQVTFSVDSIEVDAPCTSGYASPSENGHFLVISIRVTTAADMSGLETFHIIADDWKVIGPDGITETNLGTGPAYGCLAESERLTDSPMGPSQQFVGKLVLDSHSTTGFAIFAPPYLGNASGWEWVF